MPRIELVREGRTLEVTEGANLRRVLLDNGVDVYPDIKDLINCRGNGLCGTCMVEVKPAEAVTPVTFREKAKLWQYGERPVRFSCQARVHGDCRVFTRPQQAQGWYAHPFYAHLKEGIEEGTSKA